MSAPPCPVCGGSTHEIRAKVQCRQCGTILETCCEGGPMSGGCPPTVEPGTARPAQPAHTDDSQ